MMVTAVWVGGFSRQFRRPCAALRRITKQGAGWLLAHLALQGRPSISDSEANKKLTQTLSSHLHIISGHLKEKDNRISNHMKCNEKEVSKLREQSDMYTMSLFTFPCGPLMKGINL